MEILGLIPARGGSKSIPNKNITLLAGRPMLAYTCEAALASQYLKRIILSTDDPTIAEVGRKCGVEVPFLRPSKLAQDETPMLDVVRHVLNWLQEKEGYKPDIIVLLQPTSPLRKAEHIDAAVNILIKSGAESVVSVIEVPHQFNPVSVMRLENGKLVSFLPSPSILRRQDKPQIYARNGPVVLVTRREIILGKNSLYGDDCRPYIMNERDSIDVDTPLDLEIAAFHIEQRRKSL